MKRTCGAVLITVGLFSGAFAVTGDLDKDEDVDFDDFFIFADNFGKTGPVESCGPSSELPLMLSGSGTQFTSLFTLEAGLRTIRLDRTADNCCISVRMLESPSGDGFLAASLTDTDDSASASKAFKAEAGTYIINVDTEGSWTVTLDSGEALAAVEGPTITLTGSGGQASDRFTLDAGLKIITVTRTGTSCCLSVRLLHAETGDQLFDASLTDTDGASEVSKAFQVESEKVGDYVLNVDTEGGWSIEIK